MLTKSYCKIKRKQSLFIAANITKLPVKTMMKNIVIICLLALVSAGNSQNSDGRNLRATVASVYPEVNISDKLLFFVFYRNSDVDFESGSEELKKIQSTFNVARLRGGLKGIRVIKVVIDDGMTGVLARKAAGSDFLGLHISELGLNNIKSGDNLLVDADGNVVNKDIPANRRFSSVQQLITR